MSDVVIVRASSLNWAPDCMRRWAADHMTAELEAAGFKLKDRRNGISSAIGTGVHSAASTMLVEKIRTGGDVSFDVAENAAIETLHERVREGVEYDKRGTTDLSIAERQTRRMSKVYHRDVLPEIEPIHVEERLEAQVSEIIVVSGQNDVIAREPSKVRDLKTGTEPPNCHPQIGAYSLLGRSAGIDIKGACIDFIPRSPLTKNRTPFAQEPAQTVELDPAIIEKAAWSVLGHLEHSIRLFREGDERRRMLPGDPWAFPANPQTFMCSPKYCRAFGTEFCREHAPETTTSEE